MKYPSSPDPFLPGSPVVALTQHPKIPIWRVGTYGEVALNLLWPFKLEFWLKDPFWGIRLDDHVRAIDYLVEKNRVGEYPRYVYIYHNGAVGL